MTRRDSIAADLYIGLLRERRVGLLSPEGWRALQDTAEFLIELGDVRLDTLPCDELSAAPREKDHTE